MKMIPLFLLVINMLPALLLNVNPATAAGDGYYTVTETAAQRDNAAGPRLPPTADTNGNIWFTATDADYSYSLAATGRGPVISAWHQDLSSAFFGGVFIRHMSASERVAIQWQTESYTEEESFTLNSFSVILYLKGSIRFNYPSFSSQSGGNLGSGISQGDGSAFINLTSLFGPVPGMPGRSFLVTPLQLITVQVALNGTGHGRVITPTGIDCGATCAAGFDQRASVTMNAIPDFGSIFVGWSGVCNGQETSPIPEGWRMPTNEELSSAWRDNSSNRFYIIS